MGYTGTFTADAAGEPEPITIQSVCHRVTIRQNDLSNPGQWKFRANKSDDPVTFEGGMSRDIEASPGSFFHPNDVCGYVEMVTGSDTFLQIED